MSKSKKTNGFGFSELIEATQVYKGTSEEVVYEKKINQLIPFHEHPFRLYENIRMQQLIDSIEKNGIMSPLLVRPIDNDGFEIISGHNRFEAAKKVGLLHVPVIIKNVDDETAAIMMVDANFNQRELILPSEKAFAYKIKLNAIKRKAGRSKNNSGHCDQNLNGKTSRDIIAENSKDSAKQIQRYIRLTELITPLLDKVDNNELGFIPAVDISYLNKEEQGYVQEIMEFAKVKPTKVQADMLKKKSQESGLTKKDVKAILVEEKKATLSAISPTKIRSYFPKEIAKDLTDDRMNEIMQEMVTDWLKKQK